MIAVNADSKDVVKSVYSEDQWEIVEGQDFELNEPPVAVGAASVATAASGRPWGIDRVRAPEVWSLFNTRGEGIVVAVIDSGVDANHSQLRGRVEVSKGKSFVTAEAGNTNDLNGHGTHVAGTVAGTNFGVAPKATIVPIKVLNASGNGNETSVIAGINFAITQNVDVINLSLRTPFNVGQNGPGTRIDELYQDALDKAENAGIVVVVAAGNDGNGVTIGQPGRRGNVITVAALDSSNTRANFSQRGDVAPKPTSAKPDIGAPGVNIESAARNGGSSIKNGTSMASPHVAGTVALMLAAAEGKSGQGDTLELVRSAIKTSAKSLNDVESAVGKGLLDALAAVQKFTEGRIRIIPGGTTPLIDIAEVERKHKEQMKTLASIGSDLEANLERLRDRSKPEKPKGGGENGEEVIKGSFDNPSLEEAVDLELGEGAGGAGAAAVGGDPAVTRSDLIRIGLLIESRMARRLDARTHELSTRIEQLDGQIEKLNEIGKALKAFERQLWLLAPPGAAPLPPQDEKVPAEKASPAPSPTNAA